jgi:uncharacterized protein YjdB
MILRGYRGASVVVTPETHTFTTLGSTLQLAAEARDAGDNPVTGVTFDWSSSDEGVATVDNTGLVTAVSNGTATITATASGGAADSAEITVNQPPPTIDATAAGTTTATSVPAPWFTATATDVRAASASGKTFARTRFTTGHQ